MHVRERNDPVMGIDAGVPEAAFQGSFSVHGKTAKNNEGPVKNR
jgi:hypothetical protein